MVAISQYIHNPTPLLSNGFDTTNFRHLWGLQWGNYSNYGFSVIGANL